MTADGALTPVPPASLERLGWTRAEPAASIMAALEAARPGASRFVGGCVRDSLIGVAPKDIDIATTMRPDQVIAALTGAGLGAAPTGIEHGTVTGIAAHQGVEITTLRADVTTDGRRAAVAFTEDWSVDAARRDFRLNAIYLTPDLRLFDPVGGAADVAAARVRFIGEARDRIAEDFLRILRFFRFSARFSAAFDAEGLAACASARGGLRRLSAERVGDEIVKILEGPNAALAVDAMAAAGVLSAIWSEPARRADFRRLLAFEPAAPAPVGLAALWPDAESGLDLALRLSGVAARRRAAALAAAKAIEAELDGRAARAALYRLGTEAFVDGVCLAAARDRGAPGEAWQSLRELPQRWPPPQFPFTGRHVLALGVPAGPRVAAILRAVEEAWISEDFPALARAEEILRAAAQAQS